ncbi:hypothetical protein 18India_58 [Salmonella phage 18-India]|nr:hypothetical protein 18India_58 [Salmonella phage 18-India]
MMECKVCKQEFEADLEAHGPGVCIISFGCGHTMQRNKDRNPLGKHENGKCRSR